MTDKVDFDKYTTNYSELLRESTSFFSVNEAYFAKYKIDLVRENINHDVIRILEYGCGIGRNIQYIEAAFPNAEIVGTDISAASLNIAAATNPNINFEIESAGLNIGKFDVIFVAGVFHHIPIRERLSAAALLADRLQKNGTLFVFEHNPFNPITRKIVNNCPYDADAILLKPSEFKLIFEPTPLRIKKQSYCLFIPPKFSQLTLIEKYLNWLPLGGQYWVKVGHVT
ncbi:class I SAM-dependent methyltransferase [soil metagenome]